MKWYSKKADTYGTHKFLFNKIHSNKTEQYFSILEKVRASVTTIFRLSFRMLLLQEIGTFVCQSRDVVESMFAISSNDSEALCQIEYKNGSVDFKS